LDRVEEKPVNGEIAAFGVFLSVGKFNGFRPSPVLINAVTPESGDLKIRVIFQHINHKRLCNFMSKLMGIPNRIDSR
jgi:hypothetical protein